MKILHALVGYLAVTGLPFHPFAFAASPPEAIDYDGYVNKTNIDGALTKHALDSIVETCQTVTTQNHGGSALIKRVPDSGDFIEARQEGVPDIPVVSPLIISLIFAAVLLKIVWTSEDISRREAFTQNAVSNSISKYPNLNWVICHSPYSVAFDGVEGMDWGHFHYELGISLGRTIGFDLYWAKSGTFYRYGDGGFINWAYIGNILGTDGGGATVHFGTLS